LVRAELWADELGNCAESPALRGNSYAVALAFNQPVGRGSVEG